MGASFFVGLVILGARIFKATTIYTISTAMVVAGHPQYWFGIIVGIGLAAVYSMIQMALVGRLGDWKANGVLAMVAFGYGRSIPFVSGVNENLLPIVDKNAPVDKARPTLYLSLFLLIGVIIMMLVNVSVTG